MRRLATVLDTGPASLYAYFANVDELHVAVLDDLVSGLDLGRGQAAWRDRLHEVLDRYAAALHAHPALARAALVTQPSGEHHLLLLDLLLGLLLEGGVPAGQAAWGVDLLLQREIAVAAEHGTRREIGHDPEFHAVAETVAGLTAATHPHLTALAAEVFRGPPQARTRWARDAVLNGVAATSR